MREARECFPEIPTVRTVRKTEYSKAGVSGNDHLVMNLKGRHFQLFGWAGFRPSEGLDQACPLLRFQCLCPPPQSPYTETVMFNVIVLEGEVLGGN